MRKSRAFLGLAAFILMFSGAYIFACHSSHFRVSEIKIRGNDRIPLADIAERAEVCLGENIFRLDLHDLGDRLREDIRLKEVRVGRRLPGCVLVEVEEKTPLLWVNLLGPISDPENLGFYGLSIDQEIIPLSRNDLTEDLPIVSGIEINKGEPESDLIPELYRRWPNPKAEGALELYRCVARIDPSSSELIAEINLDEELNVTLYLLP
ncbi:MAG: FtsQ-type POTRA domain-containing protein, partial [Candidatus Zixiibacteriota bacterium]